MLFRLSPSPQFEFIYLNFGSKTIRFSCRFPSSWKKYVRKWRDFARDAMVEIT